MDLQPFHRWIRSRGRAAKTADDYTSQVRSAYACGNVTDRLLDDELAPNTRRLCMAALRAYGKYKKDRQLLELLDDMRLPPPENITEKQPLPPETWKALRDAIRDDDDLTEVERASLLLICRRGLRVGAVAALRREQIRQGIRDGVLVFQTKGRTLRYGVGPVREQLEVLDGVAGDWDRVAELLCPRAAPKTAVAAARRRLWSLMRDCGELVGLDDDELYPHRLRHTCATEFYKRTKDIKALKDYMQWADIKTAARYVAHMEREELDRVAEELLDD